MCVLCRIAYVTSPICAIPRGAAVEFHAHGVIGFTTKSQYINHHLVAVQSGYMPGPAIVACAPSVLSLLAWLGSLDIVVVEPPPRVGSRASALTVNIDGEMLRAMASNVLSGCVGSGELAHI